MRRAPRLLAAITATTAAAALLGAAAPPLAGRDVTAGDFSPGDFTPGTAGIGDPYYPRYGNGGYDVRGYDIRNAYDVGTGRLVGRTRLTAVATKDLSRFNLDLLLTATKVTVDGRSARFEQPGAQELVITPDRGLPAGARFDVVVRHHGRPATLEGPGLIDPWVRTEDGAIAIGEPEIAAWWFAGNDHPRDRARFDVTMLVPRGTQAISNGRLGSRARVGDQTRWSWHAKEPMATYLAFMAIGKFEIERGAAGGRPHVYAYSRQLGERAERNARRSVGRTPRIVDFLETKFGPYPFTQLGGVVPGGQFFYALENQTRPVYSRVFFGGPNLLVIAHEQAHQWYGDAVAVQSWRAIWLNEGFASFAEYLFVANTLDITAQEQFLGDYRSYGADSPFWNVRIGDPGARNEFNGAVYTRGAMTLQALRNKLGQDDFFRLMRQWARKPDNASIPEFIRRAEQAEGQQLDRFFDVWLYTREKPRRTVANGFPPPGRSGAAGRTGERVERILDRVAEARRLIIAAESRRSFG